MKTFLLTLSFLLCGLNAEAQLNKIITIKGKLSNIFLIRGDQSILVDAGSPDDYDTIVSELSNFGIKPEEITAVVLTHAHSDHAGTAKKFQENGKTKIIMGKADVDMSSRGRNNPLKPLNLTAILLDFFIDPSYPSFFPDIMVESDLDLSQMGVPAKVIAMPGHTPGSLVLNYLDGSSFVGDMIAGGIWGGFLFPFHPSQHYFHDDRERNQSNIEKLIHAGARNFYLGHGGPVSREDVITKFRIPN